MPNNFVGITFRIDRPTLQTIDAFIAAQNSHKPPDYGLPPSRHLSRSELIRHLIDSGLEVLFQTTVDQT